MILPAGPATANRTCILEKKRQQGFSVVKPLLAVASAAEVASSKVASPSPFLFSLREKCAVESALSLSLSRARASKRVGTGRRGRRAKKKRDTQRKRERERERERGVTIERGRVAITTTGDGRNSIFMQSTLRRVTLRRESPIRAPENVHDATMQRSVEKSATLYVHTLYIEREKEGRGRREEGEGRVEARGAMLI